jgi:hypothetical protein
MDVAANMHMLLHPPDNSPAIYNNVRQQGAPRNSDKPQRTPDKNQLTH